eukprot:15031350-Alexandrium_andersonii.AAC.1
MSASLVGSEMCIRDRNGAQQLGGDGRPEPTHRVATLARPQEPATDRPLAPAPGLAPPCPVPAPAPALTP